MSAADALTCARTGLLVRRLGAGHDFSGCIVATGKDRVSWLNGLVTCDLAKAKVGDTLFGLAVGKTGKIEAEVHILLGANDLAILVAADRADDLAKVLDRHLVMEDVTLDVALGAADSFLVVGPGSEAAAAAARALGARAGLVQRIAGRTAIVRADSAATSAVLEAMLGAASPSAVASDAAWDRVRAELGLPLRGVDFDESNYPQEAALERDAVSFEKGCYLGQEAVFMLEKRGHVKKRLVQLELAGSAARGDELKSSDGATVGSITTASPRDAGGSIALGVVRYKSATADTQLVAGAGVTARVTALLAVTPS
ncbi:MAG: folate-binding protein YgfZ [Polyangiaceae bacterium]